MRRRTLITIGLLAAALALTGCIGGEGSLEGADTGDELDEGDPLNPWQTGLDKEYPTPDGVEERSAEERKARVADPGDPQFASFDATMQAWMDTHDIPTGQLAIMKDGELRYASGYGYADRQQTQPADEKTMFRIASVTKPMTAALVNHQVEQGLYDWDDPVFCVPPNPDPDCRLPIDPHPQRPVVDDRLGDVQVRHLLEHTGGWDRGISGDIFFEQIEIADDLGVASPPAAWQFAQWTMGEKLDHDPGTTEAYSNAGYVLLGLVAEAATGASLEALYDAYLFEPLEIEDDIEIGHVRPDRWNEREPFYVCEGGEAPNVYDPNETVCPAEGGWSMEGAFAAPGGIIATADAVAAFNDVYNYWGEVHPDGAASWQISGSMPGTAAFTRLIFDDGTLTGELQFTVLFNKRGQDAPTYPSTSTHDVHHPLLPQATAWASADTGPMAPTSPPPLGPADASAR